MKTLADLEPDVVVELLTLRWHWQDPEGYLWLVHPRGLALRVMGVVPEARAANPRRVGDLVAQQVVEHAAAIVGTFRNYFAAHPSFLGRLDAGFLRAEGVGL